MALQSAPARDFFISYATTDRAWAEWIAWELEQAGYTTIIQAWDFTPGSDWVHSMHQATTARRTIVVLSPAYLGSAYGEAEWRVAFANDPSGERGLLLPVRVAEVTPPGLLRTRVYVDLVGLNANAARDALLQAVGQLRTRPSRAPRHPADSDEAPTQRIGSLAMGVPAFPGGLPKLWNVPYRRNQHFTGRAELLEALADHLEREEAIAVTQVVAGLGGVGKTALAVEYAYQYRDRFDLVWWVRGEVLATLMADYASLADRLDELGGDGHSLWAEVDLGARLRAVRGWFEAHDRWLMIIDNALDPAAELGLGPQLMDPQRLVDLLPRVGRGQVLVTSRDRNWEDVVVPLAIDVLRPAQAAAFLLTRTGSRDERTAARLAELLGCLPLALEQAGAYVRQAGISLSAYMERLGRFPKLLARGRARDYQATVASTWQLSIDQIRTDEPAAAELLELCAFLAPDAIYRELLTAVAELPEEVTRPAALARVVGNPLALDEAVGLLARYSLVKATEDTLGLHRLVGQMVRDKLDLPSRQLRASLAVGLVANVFPQDPTQPHSWPVCELLAPHAFTAAMHARQQQVAAESTTVILNLLGIYEAERGAYGAAQLLFEQALGSATELSEPSGLAMIHKNLGDTLLSLGDLAQARAHCEQALHLLGGPHGPNRRLVAPAVNDLGLVLHDLGEYTAAKALFERAVEINEALEGRNGVTLAINLNNLGRVLHALGDLDAARARFDRALAIQTDAGPEENLPAATTLNNLGSLLGDQGDLQGARVMLERALTYEIETYGERHPEVGKTLLSLGRLLRQLGMLTEARHCARRAVAIQLCSLGPEHPNVGMALGSLASTLLDSENPTAARIMFSRAVAVFLAAGWEDQPELAKALAGLGAVLTEFGDHDGAREHLERALQILERFYGEDHPRTIPALRQLGTTLLELHRAADALPLLQRALSLCEASSGQKDLEAIPVLLCSLGVAKHMLKDLAAAKAAFQRAFTVSGPVDWTMAQRERQRGNYGAVLMDLGQLAEARDVLEQALSALHGLDDPHPAELVRLHTYLGSVLRQLGEFDEARRLLEPVPTLTAGSAAVAEDRTTRVFVSEAVFTLAHVLLAIGQPEKAVERFEETVELEEAVYGAEHPTLAVTRGDLGGVLCGLGEYAEARAHLVQAVAIARRAGAQRGVPQLLYMLGVALRGLQEFDQARKVLVTAFELREGAATEPELLVAICAELGCALLGLGDLPSARGAFGQGLQLLGMMETPPLPLMDRIVGNLAWVTRVRPDLEGPDARWQTNHVVFHVQVGSRQAMVMNPQPDCIAR